MGREDGKKLKARPFARPWKLFTNFLQSLNGIVSAINFSRNYRLREQDIIREYHEQEIQTIEEFAVVYTYDFAYKKGLMDNAAMKEAIHKDVVLILHRLKRKGKLV